MGNLGLEHNTSVCECVYSIVKYTYLLYEHLQIFYIVLNNPYYIIVTGFGVHIDFFRNVTNIVCIPI